MRRRRVQGLVPAGGVPPESIPFPKVGGRGLKWGVRGLKQVFWIPAFAGMTNGALMSPMPIGMRLVLHGSFGSIMENG